MFDKKSSLILPFVCLFISHCTRPAERNLEDARDLVQKGHYRTALSYFEGTLKLEPDSERGLMAAEEGAKAAYYDLKDYKKSTIFYYHIIAYAKDPNSRMQAQKQLAIIFFEHLQDYKKAIIEINKVIQFPMPDSELGQAKLNLARAYYFLNDFAQAKSEIDDLLRLKTQKETQFLSKMLLGNIHLAEKEVKKAIDLFKQIMIDYPELSEKERVAMSLVVCYEEIQDYKMAIQVLNQIKPKYSQPEYIELKIKRLNERAKNQPGARGFHK